MSEQVKKRLGRPPAKPEERIYFGHHGFTLKQTEFILAQSLFREMSVSQYLRDLIDREILKQELIRSQPPVQGCRLEENKNGNWEWVEINDATSRREVGNQGLRP